MEDSSIDSKNKIKCGNCNWVSVIKNKDCESNETQVVKEGVEKRKLYKGQCSNSKCQSGFIFTQCLKCEKLTKITEKIENNLKPKCEHCTKPFAIYICPKEDCRKQIVTVVHHEGYLVTCDNPECKTEFSQLSCLKCKRLVLYLSEKKREEGENYIKAIRFVEGQVVKCPYEDCETEFSLINCFTCFKPNKIEGNKMLNGESLVCVEKSCGSKICKLFCMYCFRMLWYKDGIYHEGKKVLCPYSDCQKQFEAVKCPKCLRYNCWEENEYHCGQPAVCVYKNCGYEFKKLDCPHCGFKKENTQFKFGTNNRCTNCSNEYTYNVCVCNYTMMVKVHYSEAQGIKCINESCQKDVHNGYCPHCDNMVILLRSTYRFGMTIVCPWKNCRKKFNYLYCRGCGKGIYNKNADYVQGSIVKCQDKSCNETYQMINCGVCSRGIQYTTRADMFSSTLTCVYADCKSDFYVGQIHNTIYHPYALEFNQTGKFIVYLNPKKVSTTNDCFNEDLFDSVTLDLDKLCVEEENPESSSSWFKF